MIDSDEKSYSAIAPVPEQDFYPVSSAQKRMYVIHQLDETGTSYNMADAMLVEGKLDHGRLTEAFRGLILRHEALALRCIRWMAFRSKGACSCVIRC